MMAQGGRCMKTRIILRFFVAHITHVSCEEYSITHGFKAILWHEITPTTSGIAASARAGQNSEPRSSLWWARGGGGGRTITIRMMPLCLQNMQQIKTKTDHFTRLWGITMKTWDPSSYIMCIVPLCQWIFAFYHLNTNHHENHSSYDSLTVFKYLNNG